MFQAELRAILAVAEAIIKDKIKHSKITIFTDSRAALMAVSNMVLSSHLAKRTVYALNAASKTNEVEISWIKAHAGLQGNEEADRLAKEGAQGGAPCTDVKQPAAPLKLAILKRLKERWLREWANKPGHRQSKYWIKEDNWEDLHRTLYRLGREEMGLVLQYISGHNQLRYHSHNVNNNYSDNCRLCGQGREESVHFLMDCPRTAEASTACFGALGPADGWTASDVVAFALSQPVRRCLEKRSEIPLN